MSLKFQTAKWNVEITWERLTVTPLETTTGKQDAILPDHSNHAQTSEANYFLFDLIGQLFGPTHTQEHLSQ